MKPSGLKVLADYAEGRITATGAVLELLQLKDPAEMRQTIEAFPPEVLARLREFLREYRPDMPIVRAPSPSPAAVRMAEAILVSLVPSSS